MSGTHFTKSEKISSPEAIKKDKRKPAKFPEPQVGEEFQDYMLKLHDDCPVEQVIIFGQNIPKYFISATASLMENKNKPLYPKLLVRSLTKSQVQSILERAKETPIEVTSHRDFKDSSKIIPHYFGYASEWLIIKPVNLVNQVEIPTLQQEEAGEGDLLSQINKELIDQQVERSEKKKKK